MFKTSGCKELEKFEFVSECSVPLSRFHLLNKIKTYCGWRLYL